MKQYIFQGLDTWLLMQSHGIVVKHELVFASVGIPYTVRPRACSRITDGINCKDGNLGLFNCQYYVHTTMATYYPTC